MDHQNSSSTVEEIISLFGHAASGSINPENLFAGLASVNDSDFRKLREWALSKGCRTKDFDGAARRWRMKRELGIIPATSEEFITAYAASRNITATYNGSLTAPSGGGIFVSDYTIADLERDAMLANERLRAGFDKALIRYAIGAWVAAARPAQQAVIWAKIDDPTASRAEAEWKMFISALIDTQLVSEGYAIAVLQKFIWQVKRKMKGKPVTSHLMPVFTGHQGNGKTTAVQKFLSLIAGMQRKVSFGEITDNRNIDMWRSYALFTDEMEKAQKSDVEAIKGVITADTLDRRVLGTSNMVQIKQCGTFIGAANSSVGANIKDSTGLRRFAPLPTLGRPGRSERHVDWDIINSIDFEALWQSIQITDPDPMTAHEAELDRLQEEEREKDSVELWWDSLEPSSHRLWRDGAECGIRAEELFALFREYEDDNVRSSVKTSLQTWGRRMVRLIKDDPAGPKFTHGRVGGGVRYTPTARLVLPSGNIIELRKAG